jgi:adenosylhomocysteine nucleosidase
VTGLIVAMRREARPLLLRVGRFAKGATAGRVCWRFKLSGRDCILVHCGIGLERARAGAAALIEEAGPSVLVSFGVSGGVEEDLQVGDVVAAESSVSLDDGKPVLPLGTLSLAAFQAAEKVVSTLGARLSRGTIVTTRGAQVHPDQVKRLLHPVLDMETYGIAQAAASRGIPLLSLRGLSDSVREPLPFELAALSDSEGNFRAGRLLLQAVRHPGLLRRLPRLQENARRAEDNVAAAVLAVLSSPGIS